MRAVQRHLQRKRAELLRELNSAQVYELPAAQRQSAGVAANVERRIQTLKAEIAKVDAAMKEQR